MHPRSHGTSGASLANLLVLLLCTLGTVCSVHGGAGEPLLDNEVLDILYRLNTALDMQSDLLDSMETLVSGPVTDIDCPMAKQYGSICRSAADNINVMHNSAENAGLNGQSCDTVMDRVCFAYPTQNKDQQELQFGSFVEVSARLQQDLLASQPSSGTAKQLSGGRLLREQNTLVASLLDPVAAHRLLKCLDYWHTMGVSVELYEPQEDGFQVHYRLLGGKTNNMAAIAKVLHIAVLPQFGVLDIKADEPEEDRVIELEKGLAALNAAEFANEHLSFLELDVKPLTAAIEAGEVRRLEVHDIIVSLQRDAQNVREFLASKQQSDPRSRAAFCARRSTAMCSRFHARLERVFQRTIALLSSATQRLQKCGTNDLQSA